MSDVAHDRPDLSQPYLIARVEDALLAIPSTWVGEMIVCPDISPLPLTPKAVRGVGLRRGRAVTMLDARLRFGYRARQEEVAELVALLEAREADHVRWVDTLMHSIETGTPFTLSRDPHGCAFGKWYDHFVAPTLTLRQHMAKFASPHAAVHALADEAEELVRTSGRDAALQRIEVFRQSTLGRMRQLFSDACGLVQQDVREIVVTHEHDGQMIGLIVDAIDAVERLRPETLEDLQGRVPGLDDEVVRWSARTAKDAVVVLPDMMLLFDEMTAATLDSGR